ncbi:unnamed protein product [Amoebophrya sp. A120]|nr:unnamed protein product [Amoebophrya sp. A120]|eukprot:GSA120T00004439001.1
MGFSIHLHPDFVLTNELSSSSTSPSIFKLHAQKTPCFPTTSFAQCSYRRGATLPKAACPGVGSQAALDGGGAGGCAVQPPACCEAARRAEAAAKMIKDTMDSNWLLKLLNFGGGVHVGNAGKETGAAPAGGGAPAGGAGGGGIFGSFFGGGSGAATAGASGGPQAAGMNEFTIAATACAAKFITQGGAGSFEPRKDEVRNDRKTQTNTQSPFL